jgi:hypothetical protein
VRTHASSEIQFIYDLDFEVDQLVMFAYGPQASGAEQISISYLFSSIGPGVGSLTTSTPPFLPVVLDTFLMGISTLGGSDEHLVIFTNDGFANNTAAESLDFGTLFTAVAPTVVSSESQMIVALQEFLLSPTAGTAFITFVSEENPVVPGAFASGPHGSIAFALGDPFEAVAFTTGQIIGSGTSFETGIPESSTWVMMMVGFATLGVAGCRGAQRASRNS